MTRARVVAAVWVVGVGLVAAGISVRWGWDLGMVVAGALTLLTLWDDGKG